MIFTALSVSCKKDPAEPDKPDCEEFSYGSVQISNETGFAIWVDVSWGDMEQNDVRKLEIGADTIFLEVPAGIVSLWASFDSDDWIVDTKSLIACQDMEYTWYLSGKKSSSIELLNQMP